MIHPLPANRQPSFLPSYVVEALAKKFKGDDLINIQAHWDSYMQMSFNSATTREIIRGGQTVLDCLAYEYAEKNKPK